MWPNVTHLSHFVVLAVTCTRPLHSPLSSSILAFVSRPLAPFSDPPSLLTRGRLDLQSTWLAPLALLLRPLGVKVEAEAAAVGVGEVTGP